MGGVGGNSRPCRGQRCPIAFTGTTLPSKILSTCMSLGTSERPYWRRHGYDLGVSTTSRRPLIVAAALTSGLIAGLVAWVAWPDPPPPEEEAAEDADSGLSRDETEEMMRTIGYVQ